MLRRVLLAALITTALTLPSLAQQPAPIRPAITGIAFARFSTTEPRAAQRFYADTLGLVRHETASLWVYPVNTSQWIELDPTSPPPAPNLRMLAVAFTTRDAAGLERYLQAHNIPITQPLAGGQFAVHDPEGNLVYFVQDSTNPVAEIASNAPASPTATSRRLIHVGYVVQNAAREDAFWHDILGFRPYWHGGFKPGITDWSSLQVPDGTDWLEYMLNNRPDADLRSHGGADHISLGVPDMKTVSAALQANGCTGATCGTPKMGRDGKIQLNLYDPDLTRIEFMEYTPRQTPCCSPITGPAPTDTETR